MSVIYNWKVLLGLQHHECEVDKEGAEVDGATLERHTLKNSYVTPWIPKSWDRGFGHRTLIPLGNSSP